MKGKMIRSLFCAGVLSLTLCACGNNTQKAGNADVQATGAAAPAGTPAAQPGEQPPAGGPGESAGPMGNPETMPGEVSENGMPGNGAPAGGPENMPGPGPEGDVSGNMAPPEMNGAPGPENGQPPMAPEGNKPEDKAPAETGSIDPAGYYALAQEVASMPEMFMADADYLMNYCGIDASLLDSYVYSASEEATRADTFAFLLVKEPADTASVEASLATLKSQLETEMQDYLPDQYEIVKKALLGTKGNLVYLVISPDASGVKSKLGL